LSFSDVTEIYKYVTVHTNQQMRKRQFLPINYMRCYNYAKFIKDVYFAPPGIWTALSSVSDVLTIRLQLYQVTFLCDMY